MIATRPRAARTSRGFAAACRHRLRSGPHAGRTVDELAATEAGLLALDRLAESPGLDFADREAVDAYLIHPSSARRLAAALAAPGAPARARTAGPARGRDRLEDDR